MSNLKTIKEIEYRIEENKKKRDELGSKLLRLNAPQGYKSSTSYEDYDMIRGSRKEHRIEDYVQEVARLNNIIEFDMSLLSSLKTDINVIGILKLLKDNKDKVYFLRIIMGYTQERTGELIGLSTRRVQQIEKSLKN